jgi:hypothetical protein
MNGDDGQDRQLIPVTDVMLRVIGTLDNVWKVLSEERPDLADELALVGDDLAKLDAAMTTLNDMLAGSLTTADELRRQRDEALDQLAFREPGKRNQAIRDLAKYISWDSGIPPQDIERALEVVGGDSDLWVSEYTKGDFFEALRQLAQEVFEESVYQAALEEEEEE